jgi:hypothetical protein
LYDYYFGRNPNPSLSDNYLKISLSSSAPFPAPSNSIQTSQYNLLTFLPLNLFKQFQIPANLYFLLIGILQTIKSISNSKGRPVIFIPLSFVVVVSMFKDLLEDVRRRISDGKENMQETVVFRKDRF